MLGAGPKSCEGDRARPCANSPCRRVARLLLRSTGGEQSMGSARVLSQGSDQSERYSEDKSFPGSEVALR